MAKSPMLNSRIGRVTHWRSPSERPGSQVPSRAFWSRDPNLFWERSPESRAATCRRAPELARSVWPDKQGIETEDERFMICIERGILGVPAPRLDLLNLLLAARSKED